MAWSMKDLRSLSSLASVDVRLYVPGNHRPPVIPGYLFLRLVSPWVSRHSAVVVFPDDLLPQPLIPWNVNPLIYRDCSVWQLSPSFGFLDQLGIHHLVLQTVGHSFTDPSSETLIDCFQCNCHFPEMVLLE